MAEKTRSHAERGNESPDLSATAISRGLAGLIRSGPFPTKSKTAQPEEAPARDLTVVIWGGPASTEFIAFVPSGSPPKPRAHALAEAKAWLRVLTRDEVTKLAVSLSGGEARSEGAEKRKEAVPASNVTAGRGDGHPYAHPYYWAAVVMVGDPDRIPRNCRFPGRIGRRDLRRRGSQRERIESLIGCVSGLRSPQ